MGPRSEPCGGLRGNCHEIMMLTFRGQGREKGGARPRVQVQLCHSQAL